MTWTPALKVRVPSLDTEHQDILRLVGDLQRQVVGEQSRETLEHVLAQLTAYSIYHFAHEEELMRASGYPAFEEHQAEHQDFVARLEGFKASLRDGSLIVPLEVVEYLKGWVLRHIAVNDKDYSDYFIEQGCDFK